MNTLSKTKIFSVWLEALKDLDGKQAIARRVRLAENGNFGDAKPIGGGISEIRIHVGPGYRVYYTQQGKQVYWLLIGGDKSTQARDIERAKLIKLELERRGYEYT